MWCPMYQKRILSRLFLICQVSTSRDMCSCLFFSELEINIIFPTCWDGTNLEQLEDGGKHVVYSEECDADEHSECFDFDCPASHPVKMPELHLFVRVLDYEGGAHVFGDGTTVSRHL